MELQTSSIQEGLSAELMALRFEDGILVNEEEIIERVFDFVRQNCVEGVDITDSGTAVQAAFSPLREAFENDEIFAEFLYRCRSRIFELTCTMVEMNSSLPTAISGQLNSMESDVRLAPAKKLRDKAQNITPDLPLEDRLALSDELEGELLAFAEAGKLAYCGMVIGPDELAQVKLSHDLAWVAGHGRQVNHILNVVMEKIWEVRGEKRLMGQIGTVDREKQEQDRLRFGAKGANLIALQELLKKLQEGDLYPNLGIEIPYFELVDIEIYKRWASGENVEVDFLALYERWQEKASLNYGDLMIRSSAVFSEDGEETTGAGIYESVTVPFYASYEEFRGAIEEVYRSCNSEVAQEYRRINGVEREDMGLVLQEKVDHSTLGYANSIQPGTRNKTYVRLTTKNQAPLVFLADELDRLIFRGLMDQFSLYEAAYVQPDIDRCEILNRTNGRNILVLLRILEKYFNRKVQIEFGIRYGEFKLLQARPLPHKMFAKAPVEFPTDVEAIYESPSEGVCDEVLDVLNPDEDNGDKRGLTIKYGSDAGSTRRDKIVKSFPKAGAVMIVNSSFQGHGHIETLALERGLTVIFWREDFAVIGQTTKGIRERINATMPPDTRQSGPSTFDGQTKVRIVSDGMTARVYAV